MKILTLTTKLCLLIWIWLFQTPSTITTICSTCSYEVHSEVRTINGKPHSVRMDKCVYRPTYVIKSDVIEHPAQDVHSNRDPELRQSICSRCTAEQELQETLVDNIQIKYLRILSCEFNEDNCITNR